MGRVFNYFKERSSQTGLPLGHFQLGHFSGDFEWKKGLNLRFWTKNEENTVLMLAQMSHIQAQTVQKQAQTVHKVAQTNHIVAQSGPNVAQKLTPKGTQKESKCP